MNLAKIKEYLKEFNLKMFFVALTHFYITTFTDTRIFNMDGVGYDSSKTWLYFSIKFFVLLFLIFFYQSIPYFIKKYKENDETAKTFLKFFLIYFVINFIFLLLTWPGTWTGVDGLLMYYESIQLILGHWLHILTDYFYIFSLAIIPFPVGIVLMEIFLASVTVAYTLTNFHKLYPSKYTWLLLMIFCSPVAISNNLYPQRMWLFSYVLLAFFLTVIFKFLDSKNPITTKNIITWGILGSIIVNWRAEASFYILGIPFIILFFFYKRLNFKKILSFLLIFFTLSSGISYLQYKDQDEGTKLYKLVGLAGILSLILHTDFKSNDKQKDLIEINKLMDIETFKNHIIYDPGGKCITMHDENLINMNNGNMKKFEKTFTKLLIYNFPYIFKKRIEYYNGINECCFYGSSTVNIFEPNSVAVRNIDINGDNVNINDFKNKPFNSNLRVNIIKFLNCKHINTVEQKTFMYNIFYNTQLPVIFIFILFIIGAIKRDKMLLIIPGLLMIQGFIVVLFMPLASYYYILPFHLCSYVFMAMFLLGYYITYVNKKHLVDEAKSEQ